MSQALHVDYDGDPEALSWPIMLGTRVMGSLLQVERGYRARREAGGVAHLGPERPFTDQVLEDLWRWIEAPLSNQHAWTEATD